MALRLTPAMTKRDLPSGNAEVDTALPALVVALPAVAAITRMLRSDVRSN
jgi:hypothetical protein